jgi:hypothetical protein
MISLRVFFDTLFTHQPLFRYRKFKKGKDIGSYSATAMQEIMGKSASITYAPTYPAASTAAPVVKSEAEKSDLVTVKSKQSIQDYFKAKMAAAAAQPTSRFQVAGGQGFSEDFQADYAENLKANSYSGRIGLGFGGHSSEPMHFTGTLAKFDCSCVNFFQILNA